MEMNNFRLIFQQFDDHLGIYGIVSNIIRTSSRKKSIKVTTNPTQKNLDLKKYSFHSNFELLIISLYLFLHKSHNFLYSAKESNYIITKH